MNEDKEELKPGLVKLCPYDVATLIKKYVPLDFDYPELAKAICATFGAREIRYPSRKDKVANGDGKGNSDEWSIGFNEAIDEMKSLNSGAREQKEPVWPEKKQSIGNPQWTQEPNHAEWNRAIDACITAYQQSLNEEK